MEILHPIPSLPVMAEGMGVDAGPAGSNGGPAVARGNDFPDVDLVPAAVVEVHDEPPIL